MQSIRLRLAILASLVAAAASVLSAQSQGGDSFKFKSGV